jgi:hypothetical protein
VTLLSRVSLSLFFFCLLSSNNLIQFINMALELLELVL